jgi:isoleucyl-tRNA synthetase
MLDANATVEWTPDFYSKRMDDWLRNMGDWNISRRRYFGLPLPFYPAIVRHAERDRLARRAARARDVRARPAAGAHRPWIDEVPIRCELRRARCGA